MTTADSFDGEDGAMSGAMDFDRFERVVGARRPEAAQGRHHRPKHALVEPDQKREKLRHDDGRSFT
jgi:hypothetical protein